MHKVLARLKFLLTATNHHGVHSPFVYQFLTLGLYGQKNVSKNKTIAILLKSALYFKCKNIAIEDARIAKMLSEHLDCTTQKDKPLDLLFLAEPTKSAEEVLQKYSLHNDSLILINHIHNSRKNETVWEAFVSHPNFTVTIDGFYCGLAFIREEQVKEHFRLRI